MATRITVCPGCDEAVPGGRLSCPSCGFMLASVSGAARDGRSKMTAEAPVAADVPESAEMTTTEAPSPPEPRAALVACAPPPAGAYIPPSAAPSSASPMPARSWAGIDTPAPRPVASPGLAPALAGSISMGHGAVSMARAEVSFGPIEAGAQGSIDAGPTTAQAKAGVPPDHTETGWLEVAAGWSMVVGSALAMLGFLLPWSRTVIGAEGVGTYFDTWGIANPSHLLVGSSLAVILGLAVVANPIPTWIRTTCAGLIVGGLLVGLTWPYLFGPLGAGPGVLAILVGGVLLVLAGVLDLVEARHVPVSANV